MPNCELFKGCNAVMNPPKGQEETVAAVYAFSNGHQCVTKWTFTPDELEQIVKDGAVYLSVHMQGTMPPVFIGTESQVREMVADNGVWQK